MLPGCPGWRIALADGPQPWEDRRAAGYLKQINIDSELINYEFTEIKNFGSSNNRAAGVDEYKFQ